MCQWAVQDLSVMCSATIQIPGLPHLCAFIEIPEAWRAFARVLQACARTPQSGEVVLMHVLQARAQTLSTGRGLLLSHSQTCAKTLLEVSRSIPSMIFKQASMICRHWAHGDVLLCGHSAGAAALGRLWDRGERGGAQTRGHRAAPPASRHGADCRAVPLLLSGAL